MPEYESSTHLSPFERLTGYITFPLMLLMVWGFGWPERFLSQVLMLSLLVFAFACIPVVFWDARREAAERHRRRNPSMALGNQNWFWSSDRDPGGSGGAA